MAKKSKKVPFDHTNAADVKALAERIINASVLGDESLLPIVGRILNGTAGLIELPKESSNTTIVADVRTGMRHAPSTFPAQLKDAAGLGKLIPGGNVPSAAQPAPPPVTPVAPVAGPAAPVAAATAPAVVVAPNPTPATPAQPAAQAAVAPPPAPVAPVAPAGAAAPAGGQVFSHRIAREALDWVVDKIATMRSAQRQLLLQEVAREQAQGLPLRQPPQQFRRWPRHLEMALSDLKLMAGLNANYQADAIIEIDAAIPAPAPGVPAPGAPAPGAPAPGAPAPGAPAPGAPAPGAPAPGAPAPGAPAPGAPAPGAPAPGAPAPGALAPGAPAPGAPAPGAPAPGVPAPGAPAGNTGWTTKQMAIACGLAILTAWLLTYLVPAWHQAGIEDAAKEQITLRDRRIEALSEQVRVLRSDVSTAIEARDLAQRELRQKDLQLGVLRRDYNTTELPTLKDQLAEANAELDDLRPEVVTLREQLAIAGRKASETAAAHTTQVRGLEQRIAQLEGEVSRLDAFNRQLLNPNFAGAPVTMEMKTFNLAVGTSCELRIRHFTQTEFDRFQLPGGGGGRVATFDGIFATRAGWHDYQIWQNGRKTFEDRVLVVPGSRTQWVRETDGHNWQSVTASGDNPMLLIRAGGQQSTINPNTGVVSTARR